MSQAGWNFVQCVCMLVSSIVYLTRLHNFIDEGDEIKRMRRPNDPTCVTSLVPVDSTMTCVNLRKWETCAILGIVRGSLYILQILIDCCCRKKLANEADESSKGRVLTHCVLLVFGLLLLSISCYLAVELIRTKAIYTPLSSLADPAIAILVFCILELLGLLVFIFCAIPLILGIACCSICGFCGDTTGKQRGHYQQPGTAMNP